MQSIYQDQLLALARGARASTALSAPTHTAEMNNPVCGDRIRATLTVAGDTITHAHAEAKGCALCEAGRASAGDGWPEMAALPGLYDTLTDWRKAGLPGRFSLI